MGGVILATPMEISDIFKEDEVRGDDPYRVKRVMRGASCGAQARLLFDRAGAWRGERTGELVGIVSTFVDCEWRRCWSAGHHILSAGLQRPQENWCETSF